MENNTGKGRKQLVLLLALFIAPIVIAVIMYNSIPEGGGPGKTKNYGELVIPARPLIDVKLQTEEGKDFRFSDMHKTWVMIYIGDADCNKECTETLYKMRQSRLAQRGEHLRIKRLYISTNGKAKKSLIETLKVHPGLELVSGDEASINKVLKQFELDQEHAVKTAKRLYLVDPFGNLMMSYKYGFDAKGLVKDLTLLLKVSQIG